MPPIPIPKPSYLAGCEYLGAFSSERRWRTHGGDRIFTWDCRHGEIEVFNKRGRHLGVIDSINGNQIKDAVPGRKINV